MDDTTISAIVEAARAMPPELQGQWIARQAIAAARDADAGLSDQALEAEYLAWYGRKYGRSPGAIGTTWAIGWGRHLLSGGRHA